MKKVKRMREMNFMAINFLIEPRNITTSMKL